MEELRKGVSFFVLLWPEEHEGLVSLLPLRTLLFDFLRLLLLGLAGVLSPSGFDGDVVG
jgi:hypothetical protein